MGKREGKQAEGVCVCRGEGEQAEGVWVGGGGGEQADQRKKTSHTYMLSEQALFFGLLR